MTAQVYILGTQPIAQAAGPAYAIPAGAAGTVLTSDGVDQIPRFVALATPGAQGSNNAIQYNNGGNFAGAGPGLARQVLMTPTDNAAPVWGGFSGARVRSAVNQGANNAVLTAVTFDTETYDIDNYFVIGAPTRLTAPFAGYYLLEANLEFSAGGFIVYQIQFNGTATVIATFAPSVALGASARTSIAAPWQFAAGQYAEVFALNTGGGNIAAADGCPHFSMTYLGP